eukprot:g7400.t1
MSSVGTRLWLRKEATDNDEASSDVSSQREGFVFSDSEVCESLNEADNSNRLPISVDDKTSVICCCTGLCNLQNTTQLDCWNGMSKLLVSDRRKLLNVKTKRARKPPTFTRRRSRMMITVGVQTSPEDLTTPSNSSTLLNPLETQTSNGLNPFAKPFEPQLP